LTGPHQQKLNAIHPPIDRVLLTALKQGKIGGKISAWNDHLQIGWSSFTSPQYEAVISAVRQVVGHELWRIEEYWAGYQ